MENKEIHQLGMPKKLGNPYVRADKELDEILSKQCQRFFPSIICETS